MGLNTRFPSVMFYTVPQISHLGWRIAETKKKKPKKQVCNDKSLCVV